VIQRQAAGAKTGVNSGANSGAKTGVNTGANAGGKGLSFYQNAPNYCQDTWFTGLLHRVGKKKVCFRQFEINKKEPKGCYPSHHICFDPKTGDSSDDHTDNIGSMKGKDSDGKCIRDGDCDLLHFKHDVLKGIVGPEEKPGPGGGKVQQHVSLPGEEESRNNTDPF
jgi:hypothetical protein